MLISFLHNYFDVPTKLLSDLYLRFRYFKKIIFSCICIYELYLFNWIYQISKLCNQIFFSYFWILNYSSVNWFRVESLYTHILQWVYWVHYLHDCGKFIRPIESAPYRSRLVARFSSSITPFLQIHYSMTIPLAAGERTGVIINANCRCCYSACTSLCLQSLLWPKVRIHT